jgi:hypothetical protein
VSLAISVTTCADLKQSLAALRAGQESYTQFVTDLFSDLELLRGRLTQAESQMAVQREQIAELQTPVLEEIQPAVNEPSAVDSELKIRVSELENERRALEEELENIRGRAVNMAEIISGQKRQMSDEHSQWMTELRQLRRILDRQTKWITQQSDTGLASQPASNLGHRLAGLSAGPVATAVLDLDGNGYTDDLATDHPLPPHAQYPEPPRSAAEKRNDPVLGSVLSQFEILQKDVARRRKQK